MWCVAGIGSGALRTQVGEGPSQPSADPAGTNPAPAWGDLHQPGCLLLGAAVEAGEPMTGCQLWHLAATHADQPNGADRYDALPLIGPTATSAGAHAGFAQTGQGDRAVAGFTRRAPLAMVE